MNGEKPASPFHPPPTADVVAPLLRALVSHYVSPPRVDSSLAVATRLLDSALKTAPSVKSSDALVRSMIVRLKREGRDSAANALASVTTSLKFDRAMQPAVLFPVLYVFNDLRDSAPSTAPSPSPAAAQQQHYPQALPSPKGMFEPPPSAALKLAVPPLYNSTSEQNGGPANASPSPRLSAAASPRATSSSPRATSASGSFRRKPSLPKEPAPPPHSPHSPPSPQQSHAAHNQSLEKTLVQDLLLLVQGEDGAYISFTSGGRREDERVRIQLPHGMQLSLPVDDMVHCIAELGFLFRVIRAHIAPSEAPPHPPGLIVNNFHIGVDKELDNYYKSILTLRGTSTTAAPAPSAATSSADLTAPFGALPTLRTMYIWANREKQKLRWLARLCDEIRSLHGGQVITHLRCRNGCYISNEISDMMNRLLSVVCAPLNVMLIKWLAQGDLSADRHSEFFIMEDPKVAANVAAANPFSTSTSMIVTDDDALLGAPNTASATSHRIWWGLFKARPKMIPNDGILDEATIEKILITGKSIAFMRRCCQDVEWVNNVHGPLVEALVRDKLIFEIDLRYHENVVCDIIDRAYASASKRLKELFFVKFNLSHHFSAIKNYLLLSQGDFAQSLMDNLCGILDGGKEILQYNLTNYVDVALQTCSSFSEVADWDIMERLDVLTEVRDGVPVRSGWDVFSLTYRVEDAPLNTVFSRKVMDAYLLVFKLLWRLKRMDHLMSMTYTNLRETEKKLRRKRKRTFGRESEDEDEEEEEEEEEDDDDDDDEKDEDEDDDDKAGDDAETVSSGSHTVKTDDYIMKKVHFLRMKIIHLVHNVQHYCKMEVLEGCWSELERDMKDAENLDEMIIAHARYLTKIKDMTLQSDRSAYVARELESVLDIVPSFGELQHDVCTCLLAAKELQDRRQREALVDQLADIEREFDARFIKLINVLRDHCQIVDACGFLLFRLDFNEYYVRKEALHDDADVVTVTSPGVSTDRQQQRSSDSPRRPPAPTSSDSGNNNASNNSNSNNFSNRPNKPLQQTYTLKM